MNRLIFISSFLVLYLFPLSAQAQVRCPSGNNSLTAYIERKDDRRCEGIQFIPHSGNGFDLISLTIGNPQASQNRELKLQVPLVAGGATPIVGVKAWTDRNGSEKYYQLDPLTFRPVGSFQEFRWSTRDVLDRENIPYSNLRALASSSGTYLPVVFNSSGSKEYKFVLMGDRPVKIKSFQIRDRNGKVVYSVPTRDYNKGEVSLIWNGRGSDGQPVPAGRYRLSIDAELKRPADPAPITISFEHNPQWLK